jgi:GNAT superfamily N-acetyltransferase
MRHPAWQHYGRGVPLDVLPATGDRFSDIAAVLAPSGKGACWCMYYRMTSSQYGRVPAHQLPQAARTRRDLLHARADEPPAPGMLAYLDGMPVGWCGLGPRTEFARLQRSRTIPAVDGLAVWSVVCFLVRPGYRRRGIAAALLAGAVEYARDCGAPALEGYPVDSAGARIDSTFAYVGTTSMFEAAGFHRITETKAHSAGLPRIIMRLRLTGCTTAITATSG